MKISQERIINDYLKKDAKTFMRLMQNRRIPQTVWGPILKDYLENLDPGMEDNGMGTFKEPKKRTGWQD